MAALEGVTDEGSALTCFVLVPDLNCPAAHKFCTQVPLVHQTHKLGTATTKYKTCQWHTSGF